jgi:Xaa-Pro aminopeptidase
VKSGAELDRIREAFAVADRVYARLFAGELRAGESEQALAIRISRMMLEEGADEPGWVIITAGRGSYDRLLSSPRPRLLERGELIWLDMACRIDGYWSDHSRAAVVGAPPTAEQVGLQERVIAATHRGIAAVAPGATFGAVATAAALEGEAIPGRIGHGLGLGSTEPPDVVAGSTQVLVPGMVFTVEPMAVREHGMYQAEAVVAVTDGGCELLTHAPEAIATV